MDPQKSGQCTICGTVYTGEVRYCYRDGAKLRAPNTVRVGSSQPTDRRPLLSEPGQGDAVTAPAAAPTAALPTTDLTARSDRHTPLESMPTPLAHLSERDL